MIKFITEHRSVCGIEPICRILQIAPSTYHLHLAKQNDPNKRSRRVRRDDVLKPDIQRIFDANRRVYGARKLWHQMKREGFSIARCTVERLMRDLGLRGVIRGKTQQMNRPEFIGGLFV